MEREEKALDIALDAMISRTQDLKNSIASFIVKLETEYETLQWPSVLDSFALLSGQLNTLLKVLRNDKTPPLRNRILLPLLLNPERDEELAKLTENRIQFFNHEVVPDYLRTKPDPEIEAAELQVTSKASLLSLDTAQKQIAALNKAANTILDGVKNLQENWESNSGQRGTIAQTSSLQDTNALIAALSVGKGLRPSLGSPKSQSPLPQVSGQQRGGKAFAMHPGGKMPSTIKTNIKSAGASHPYGRW
ncbi:mediator of RNA polymerase II transcription subunit 8 [Ixodes scapularis]